eukprot:71180-Pelagomonas_calceolata.AAC.2
MKKTLMNNVCDILSRIGKKARVYKGDLSPSVKGRLNIICIFFPCPEPGSTALLRASADANKVPVTKPVQSGASRGQEQKK